jgi:hypothetical protein
MPGATEVTLQTLETEPVLDTNQLNLSPVPLKEIWLFSDFGIKLVLQG